MINIPKGVDKIQTTVRIDEQDYNLIEKISKNKNKSFNSVLNILLKYGIKNLDESEL